MSKLYPITIPKWGMDMAEGTIVTWSVAVDETIEKGAPLLEIESDKIVNEMESPATGTLARIVVDEGEAADVGQLIGVIALEAVTADEIDAFINDFKPIDTAMGVGGEQTEEAKPAAPSQSPSPVTASSPITPPSPVTTSTPAVGQRVRVSPVVKRLANKLGVDLQSVAGSGPNGRILQHDVERVASGEVPAMASAASYVTETLSATRKTIARNLQSSKQEIPHYRVGVDINMDTAIASHGKSNVNAVMISVVAKTLAQDSRLNCHLVGDEVRRFTDVNIGVAVATDLGLLVPVVRGASEKSVSDLSHEIRGLAERARSGGLQREDLEGATFTVSNLGMLGADWFDAIINPPQVGILALGKMALQPVATPDGLGSANVLTATLSSDHRVIDGAVAAEFLTALKATVEES